MRREHWSLWALGCNWCPLTLLCWAFPTAGVPRLRVGPYLELWGLVNQESVLLLLRSPTAPSGTLISLRFLLFYFYLFNFILKRTI